MVFSIVNITHLLLILWKDKGKWLKKTFITYVTFSERLRQWQRSSIKAASLKVLLHFPQNAHSANHIKYLCILKDLSSSVFLFPSVLFSLCIILFSSMSVDFFFSLIYLPSFSSGIFLSFCALFHKTRQAQHCVSFCITCAHTFLLSSPKLDSKSRQFHKHFLTLIFHVTDFFSVWTCSPEISESHLFEVQIHSFNPSIHSNSNPFSTHLIYHMSGNYYNSLTCLWSEQIITQSLLNYA